ncbi:MAG: ImmA/IrrE family metallo-endopeptidase, partial [Acidimicrobiia bacterium]|nr:ImmA/IrrE family metallo-endopeptidase [Acidimicrobiia bacterium]
LLSLADTLRFPVGYFGNDLADSQPDTPAFFRSLRSTSVQDRKHARAYVELVREFVLSLEREVELPPNSVPRYPFDPESRDLKMVDTIAAATREEFGLDEYGPIPNVVASIETRGVVVTRTHFDTEKVDAFSVAYEDRPVLVLCSDKNLFDRSRFDAAHELGHLVMHFTGYPDIKEIEQQAHRFAASFLMPEQGIGEELPTRADWAQLVALKRRWGVSIGALLKRAETLNRMTPERYVQALKTMSARGWRTHEPAPLGPPESPRLLHEAIRILEEDGFTIEDLADRASLPREEVANIIQATMPTRRRVTI